MVKSFYFKQAKKGQAAIEFLMTYGWMLLVVLIVGALIFSFVDFGNLLPNTVEMSNNFRAEPTQTRAIAEGADGNSSVLISFSYNGNERITLEASNLSQIRGAVDEECELVWIKNTNTDASSDLNPSPGFEVDPGSQQTEVVFLRGHSGLIEYSCSTLIPGDVLEGQLVLRATVAQTGFPLRSQGAFRVSVE
ncbi:MAG: hypothetical protein LAT82_04055 [Nanoarchaeota archaeon]|nr:hypothetical protein [Nanoarchaeota archaeon]